MPPVPPFRERSREDASPSRGSGSPSTPDPPHRKAGSPRGSDPPTASAARSSPGESPWMGICSWPSLSPRTPPHLRGSRARYRRLAPSRTPRSVQPAPRPYHSLQHGAGHPLPTVAGVGRIYTCPEGGRPRTAGPTAHCPAHGRAPNPPLLLHRPPRGRLLPLRQAGRRLRSEPGTRSAPVSLLLPPPIRNPPRRGAADRPAHPRSKPAHREGMGACPVPCS